MFHNSSTCLCIFGSSSIRKLSSLQRFVACRDRMSTLLWRRQTSSFSALQRRKFEDYICQRQSMARQPGIINCDYQRKSFSSGKNKSKQQAMQKQRDQNNKSKQQTKVTDPTISAMNKPSSKASKPTILKPTHPPLAGGLARLDLHPNLNQYFVGDRNNDKDHNHTNEWETNKSNAGLLRLQHNQNNDDILSVDPNSMFDPTIHLPYAPQNWKGYEPSTPLTDFLIQRIGVSGQPITTAEYMRHALTHPLYGYYTSIQNQITKKDDDWNDNDYDNESINENSTSSDLNSSTIFGRHGDFITSPELSSVFGHALCIWFMTIWQQQPLGRPSIIQMVEFGPGRGRLVSDILELAHSSKLLDFGQSIKHLHLIETSNTLRQEQKETLQKSVGHLIKFEFIESDDSDIINDKNDDTTASTTTDNGKGHVNTIRVEWHKDFISFQTKRNKDIPTMMILQEFLDALPVHQFQKTEEGWRERMIDVVSVDDVDRDEKSATATSSETEEEQIAKPRLRQVLAPHSTPAVELLLSPNKEQYDHFPVGTVIEICPEALFLLQDIAKVIEESQGAALIIDYGEEGTSDTLRAFSKHKQVPLTSQPGLVDVTADVDFFALKNCLSSKMHYSIKKETDVGDGSLQTGNEVHAFGPVKQGEFLMKMGAGELTMNAIEKPETSEDQAQAMADALKYLVMPEHMGEKFKVLALARKRDGLFGPAGME